ncbi:MAG: 3-dehydroquinate synthase [Treponema sp.]|nr:3-dehydroquinate synthase [Treponema sp.]
MQYIFDNFSTDIQITRNIPALGDIAAKFNIKIDNTAFKPLFIADENTVITAKKIINGAGCPCCVLKSGEENKTWQAVETVLSAAVNAGIGRDGIFIAAGGGVISDIAGFAASIYMRGCRFAVVSTTLLGMVDASVGGKTGFDIFGIKNMAGSFYPAQAVYMPFDCLSSLPPREWKSGYAELIKTAVLSGDDFLDQLASNVKCCNGKISVSDDLLLEYIKRAVEYKAAVVSEDLRESGRRKLLNLGHTFAHALESVCGFGKISHGEAVAWGIARSCELGLALRITPEARAHKIKSLLVSSGYECACPHPDAENAASLFQFIISDKKNRDGKFVFIVPDGNSAEIVQLGTEKEISLIENILKGNASS